MDYQTESTSTTSRYPILVQDQDGDRPNARSFRQSLARHAEQRNKLIPRLRTTIQSLTKEAQQEITLDMGAGPVGEMALKLLEEEVKKKTEDRKKTYDDGQRSTAAAAKKRKFNSATTQQHSHPPHRDSRPRQQNSQRHRPQRQDTNSRNGAQRGKFRSAGWTTTRDRR